MALAKDVVQRLPYPELAAQVQRGARFVQYQYLISALVVSFRRNSELFYIAPGESAVTPGLLYSLLSLLVGWWGFPWGFIRTPIAIFRNFSGGIDLTNEVMQRLAASWTA